MADHSFADVVAQGMASICSDFGFRETHRDIRTVRFDSDSVYFTFMYMRFNEVEFTFGRIAEQTSNKMEFSLFDVLYSASPKIAADSHMRSASSPEQIAEAVREIVTGLRNYGQGLLSNDPKVFESFSKVRAERQKRYGDETVAARVRPEAEKAFKMGDYVTAVRLYRSIGDLLSDVERRKLSFAEGKTLPKSDRAS